MKRCILMGGRPWLATDGGKRQVEVLLRSFPRRAHLAFCLLAQDESDWAETRRVNIEMIDRFAGAVRVIYQTMTTDNIAEASAWADIIYIVGGSPPKLLQELSAARLDLAELWDGKVIAGSSAGMDVLCAHFSYLQTREILAGLGWIKASCIPHWRNEGEDFEMQSWAEGELARRYPALPILCVAEGDFCEVTVA